jgi:hypothetical protein
MDPIDVLAPIGLAAGAGAFGTTAFALRASSRARTTEDRQGGPPRARQTKRRPRKSARRAKRRPGEEGQAEA